MDIKTEVIIMATRRRRTIREPRTLRASLPHTIRRASARENMPHGLRWRSPWRTSMTAKRTRASIMTGRYRIRDRAGTRAMGRIPGACQPSTRLTRDPKGRYTCCFMRMRVQLMGNYCWHHGNGNDTGRHLLIPGWSEWLLFLIRDAVMRHGTARVINT